MASPETLKRELQKRRKKLREQGMSEAAVEAAIERYLLERANRQPGSQPELNIPRLRERLRREGMSEELIGREVERRRWKHLVATQGRKRAAEILYEEAPEQPADGRYRPKHIDSTLTGVGRATGETAAAVRRGRTVTKWQHDQRTGERGSV